ncbi:MAG: exodeoxyribonuclease VII large subunit [Elusimicrobiaceae bacterium]|nr:exodeoxyribonuclease VII large subunit [Elusimicrobiaceae bacterium]
MKLPLHDKILTVSELNGIIKNMLEGTFPEMQVRGEISNLRRAASGHVYFDLKDRDSLISAVMFKWYATQVKPELKDGLEVTVRGELSCYLKQGRYQLAVKTMEGRDTGELYREFERLKKKLADEGLFDARKKRPIPPFPSLIGVVTSPNGAALRDILTVLKRRSANLDVLIAPALVQGETAKTTIVQAIRLLNEAAPRPDVLLVGRGGGSIEDLWPFNEETVARAIAGSAIPVIACVGHETDFTIADFAADLRAATPSAAAELVTSDSGETLSALHSLRGRLVQGFKMTVRHFGNRLSSAQTSHYFKRPQAVWSDRLQETDRLRELLLSNLNNLLAAQTRRYELLRGKLSARRPELLVENRLAALRHKTQAAAALLAGKLAAREQLVTLHAGTLSLHSPLRAAQVFGSANAALYARLSAATASSLQNKAARARLQAEKLGALSPEAVLNRGYSIVRSGRTGHIVSDGAALSLGEPVALTFARGKRDAVITDGTKPARVRAGKDTDQPSLFGD